MDLRDPEGNFLGLVWPGSLSAAEYEKTLRAFDEGGTAYTAEERRAWLRYLDEALERGGDAIGRRNPPDLFEEFRRLAREDRLLVGGK